MRTKRPGGPRPGRDRFRVIDGGKSEPPSNLPGAVSIGRTENPPRCPDTLTRIQPPTERLLYPYTKDSYHEFHDMGYPGITFHNELIRNYGQKIDATTRLLPSDFFSRDTPPNEMAKVLRLAETRIVEKLRPPVAPPKKNTLATWFDKLFVVPEEPLKEASQESEKHTSRILTGVRLQKADADHAAFMEVYGLASFSGQKSFALQKFILNQQKKYLNTHPGQLFSVEHIPIKIDGHTYLLECSIDDDGEWGDMMNMQMHVRVPYGWNRTTVMLCETGQEQYGQLAMQLLSIIQGQLVAIGRIRHDWNPFQLQSQARGFVGCVPSTLELELNSKPKQLQTIERV